jgi:hypothetical protein
VKLIIRQYLASLRERDELDAVLPDLLSESGFLVYSRPGRGTVQHGVDIAAVGKDKKDGERKLFLFSVKQGDLTRQAWDGSGPQSLRSSLNDVQDAYIPSRVPSEYKDLKVVICLCFGGDMQEQVRSSVEGYIAQHTTERLSFQEWNGDRLAELLLQGLLREKVLPKTLRTSFQKAVALVDEPDVAYRHFVDLVRQLRRSASNSKSRILASRQIYLCLWILFVWARDADNLESPYLASEIALLETWYLLRPSLGKETKEAKSLGIVIDQLIRLHVLIAATFFEQKIFPHIEKRHAISVAIKTRNSADVNQKLFELIGRLGMTGLWLRWFSDLQTSPDESNENALMIVTQWGANGFKLIANNPSLLCPLADEQAIDITLFLLLAAANPDVHRDIANWLREIVSRMDFTLRTHGKYPCVYRDYTDLAEHPKDPSSEYRKESTSGSILIPLLSAWLSAFNDGKSLQTLVELKGSILSHCTLQLWLPDDETEGELYTGGRGHGIALTDLPMTENGDTLFETILEACERRDSFKRLSPIRTRFWPIVLLACRHYRHPVPPQFWVEQLKPPSPSPKES